MEKFAYGYLDMTPEQFWDMTPRQFNNKQKGFYEKNAYLAILNRRAMNEKKVSMHSLLGKQNHQSEVISLEEKRRYFEESPLPQTI